jgi:hypothetical protein
LLPAYGSATLSILSGSSENGGGAGEWLISGKARRGRGVETLVVTWLAARCIGLGLKQGDTMDPFVPVPRSVRLWGAVGALLAAVFAIWMFFFPDLIPSHFAWVAEPRLAQAFIGAGYVFRTAFFLQFVLAKNWLHIRWAFWGNLAFTGTLLLATLWHADEMNWRFLMAHLWVIFYIYEPVTMIFMAPMRGGAQAVLDHGRTDPAMV